MEEEVSITAALMIPSAKVKASFLESPILSTFLRQNPAFRYSVSIGNQIAENCIPRIKVETMAFDLSKLVMHEPQ